RERGVQRARAGPPGRPVGARGRVRRRRWTAGPALRGLPAPLGRDDQAAPRAPGGDMVTDAAELEVLAALSLVHDPEIPPLSITDLGIVERVRVTDDGVDVDLLPTFSGCPALDVIREDAERAVRGAAGGREVRV